MSISFEIVVFLILLALAFDFLNGFHDAANSIATIVSTGAMSPHWAVAWAAFFNFVAFLVFGFAVATTIGKGIVDPAIVDHYVIFGALCGAIAWNLIGKLVASGVLKTAVAIVLSPLFGFMLAITLMIAVSWIFARATPRRVDRWFRRLQFVSAALYSLGHGGNDAQKTMGIIWMLLIASGLSTASEPLPFWVVLACQAAMGLGTLFGGWRIVKTMGMRITKLKPVGGFCASASGAMALFLATALGIPVSTTHTITGSIIGVGSVQKLSAVRWGVAGNIVWAWIFTIPGSAFIAGIAWLLGTEYF